MKIAHLVITVTETVKDKDPIVDFSYSGGDEFEGEKAKEAFDCIRDAMSDYFNMAKEQHGKGFLE